MEMKANLKDAKRAARGEEDPMRALHRMGVRSKHAYLGAGVSLALSLVLRLGARRKHGDEGGGSAWGGFFGNLAPILLLAGWGLAHEER